MIILLYCLQKRPSRAIWHANKVLPEPAEPASKVSVLFNIASFAIFCSSFKVSLNFIGFFGILFFLNTSSVWWFDFWSLVSCLCIYYIYFIMYILMRENWNQHTSAWCQPDSSICIIIFWGKNHNTYIIFHLSSFHRRSVCR